MNKLKKLLLLLLLYPPIFAAGTAVSGNCEKGSGQVTIAGMQSTVPYVQSSYPSCTVTVFIQGTQTPAAIFSDSIGTVKANPFIAGSDGYWSFYANNGNLDVQLSGAGIQTPFIRTYGITGSFITPPANAIPLCTNSSGGFIACTSQGNGTKVQLSTGTTAPNDLVVFDANGNTIDSGASPTGQLQYVRSKPNTYSGNNNTLQFSLLPTINAIDYSFPAISPGGSLTGANPSTVTFPNGPPLGLAATDATHPIYLSGGVGTAEAINITGGTCTLNQLTSCTITFTPANNHSGAWTITSATAGCQEAFYSNGGIGGVIVYPSGNFNVYATCTINGGGNTQIRGAGIAMTSLFMVSLNVPIFRFSGTNPQIGNGLFDMSLNGAGGSTTGYGLEWVNQTFSSMIRVYVNGFPSGILGNNAGVYFHDIVVKNITSATGDGMFLTGNNSGPTIDNLLVASVGACEAGLRIVRGGAVVSNSNLINCNYGALINPTGTDQVASVEFVMTYFDHVQVAGLSVSPSASASVVRTRCIGCWASSTAGGNGMEFLGTGLTQGMIIDGANISQNGAPGNGLLLNNGSDFTISNSVFSNNAAAGINLGANATKVRIENNALGNNLQGWGAGTQTYGVFSSITANDWSLIGNTFTGNATSPVSIPTTQTGVVNISLNAGIDDNINTIASAASITVFANPLYYITGTTAIGTINGTWKGRTISLIFTNAAPGGLVAGANVARTQAAAQNQKITLTFDGSFWY